MFASPNIFSYGGNLYEGRDVGLATPCHFIAAFGLLKAAFATEEKTYRHSKGLPACPSRPKAGARIGLIYIKDPQTVEL